MLRQFESTAFAILVLFAAGVAGGRAADRDAPVTPVDTVTDAYHGVTVADPYRWLERGDDKRVHDWSVAQDDRTRAYLDALAVRKPIHDRLTRLASQTSPSYSGLYAVRDKIFATYNQPPKQQPMIAMLGRDADPPRIPQLADLILGRLNQVGENGRPASCPAQALFGDGPRAGLISPDERLDQPRHRRSPRHPI